MDATASTLRRPPLLAAFLTSALVALAAPAWAGATTYCVDTPPGCVGTAVAAANLQSGALSDGVHRSDGVADTIVLSANTFTAPSTWSTTGSDPLEIRGQGAACTVLTSSASNANIFVVDLGSSGPVTMRDLTVRIPSSFGVNKGAGMQAGGTNSPSDLENVNIDSRTPGSNAIPSIIDGGTYRGGTISGSNGGSVNIGISPNSGGGAGTVTVDGATIIATTPIQNQSSINPVTITRSRLTANGQAVVEADRAAVSVDDSLLSSKGFYPLSAFTNSANASSITADHVTLVKQDPAAPYGPVEATVTAAGSANASVTVSNSIMRGYSFAYLRQSSGAGSANVTLRYSDFTLGSSTSNGPGTATTNEGNIDQNPVYAGAMDFHLTAGSPAIDAGDPAAGGPTLDLDGNPRVLDGNGDCVARRDMGAYEFQGGACVPPGGGGGGSGSGATGAVPTGGASTPPPGAGPVPSVGRGSFGARTGIAFAAGRLSPDRSGRITVRLRNRNPFAATGALAVQARLGRHSGKGASLARATFSLPAGATRGIRVKLSSRVLAAIRRQRKVRATLRARVTDPAGASRTVTVGGVLVRAKRRPAHRRARRR